MLVLQRRFNPMKTVLLIASACLLGLLSTTGASLPYPILPPLFAGGSGYDVVVPSSTHCRPWFNNPKAREGFAAWYIGSTPGAPGITMPLTMICPSIH